VAAVAVCVVAAVVQSKCEPVLERFNFRWPGVLDCARLPDGAADNSQLCIDPPSPGDQLDDALGLAPPPQLAPASNPQLRRLLDALRAASAHNSSSWQHDAVLAAAAGNSRDAGNSPASSRGGGGGGSTVLTSLCPRRYVMAADSSSSSICRPRCGVDVLYRADDKRSVHGRRYSLSLGRIAQIRPIVARSVVCLSVCLFGTLVSWRRGVVVSGVRRMNEVNARRARLVPGWLTIVFGRVYHLGM